jgi:hypothetical protein
MKLVRKGVHANSREPSGGERLAARARELLLPILGPEGASDVANNAAAGFMFEEDEIYQPEESFSETVRIALVHRKKNRPHPRYTRLSDETIEQAVEAVKPLDSLRPNGLISTLRGRASMETQGVGREVDPDRYTGRRGQALDAAMSRYEVFHAKRPMRVVDLGHELPSQVVPVGQVLSTMYRTDKWHKDGDDEDYKHVHDNSRGGKDREYSFGKGVIAYEPAREVRRSVIESGGKRSKTTVITKSERFPVAKPEALTLLGYCLGFFIQRFDDEEIYELNPRGCYLFCSPSGDMLAVYSPKAQPDGSKGFLVIMAGGGLRVLKDGIDG